jgi:hypothetical protein
MRTSSCVLLVHGYQVSLMGGGQAELQPRTLRDACLIALVGLFGGLLFCRLVTFAFLPALKFEYGLAPLGQLILSAVVAALMLSAAVAGARLPRTGLSTGAVVLALVCVPMVSLGPGLSFTVSSLVLITGILCLEAGSVIVAVRTNAGRAVLPTVLVGITLVMTAGTLLCSVFVGMIGEETVLINAHSADGVWTVSGIRWDEGALGGQVDVSVSRTVCGLIEQERTVYCGEWYATPEAGWVDSHTLLINGSEFDIFRDPPINDY